MNNPLQVINEITRNDLMELGLNIKNEKEYMARKFEYEKDPLNVKQTIKFYSDEIKDCESGTIIDENEEQDLNITEEPKSAMFEITDPSKKELDDSAIDFY